MGLFLFLTLYFAILAENAREPLIWFGLSIVASSAIHRPFTLRGLAEKVREVLDSGEGR